MCRHSRCRANERQPKDVSLDGPKFSAFSTYHSPCQDQGEPVLRIGLEEINQRKKRGIGQTSLDSENLGQHLWEAESTLPVNHIWHTWTFEKFLADNPVICLCCHVANIWM